MDSKKPYLYYFILIKTLTESPDHIKYCMPLGYFLCKYFFILDNYLIPNICECLAQAFKELIELLKTKLFPCPQNDIGDFK